MKYYGGEYPLRYKAQHENDVVSLEIVCFTSLYVNL